MNQHTIYMQRAIRLAERGLYTTDPNPRVGCVIVKDNVVIAEAWHKRYGEPHAEVLAIDAAADDVKGATAYVTLEPCSHIGKTPPCVNGLIDAGIKEVYVAMQDPNPLVAGKGLEKLASAGIKVHCGLLEASAKALNPGFIKRMETGLPYVRVKMAMSLDGRTAMESGESQWITGEYARRDVQKLRARSTVVMSGINTILTDDPSLDVRLNSDELDIEGKVNQPIRVVLDTDGRFPDTAKMLETGGDVIVYTNGRSINNTKCEFVSIEKKDSGLDLKQVLLDLAKREANEVHVEAGATLCGALLKEKLVDEVVIYVAPHIMGADAKGLFDIPGLEKMKDVINLNIVDVRKVGQDIRFTSLPVYN